MVPIYLDDIASRYFFNRKRKIKHLGFVYVEIVTCILEKMGYVTVEHFLLRKWLKSLVKVVVSTHGAYERVPRVSIYEIHIQPSAV